MKPYLSLIVTVRNEERTILGTLLSLDYALSLSEFSSEVIIVDDASHDGTVRVVTHYEKVLKQLKCIERTRSGGLGQAVKDGIAASHGNVRLILFPSCVGFLSTREEIVAAFKNGADLVTGSRNLGTEPLPFVRTLQRMFRRWGNRLLAGKLVKTVSDIRFGALAMTEEAAEWLFAFPELSSRSDIFFELYALSEANGFTIHELAYRGSDRCSWGRGFVEWLITYAHVCMTRYRTRRAVPKKKEERLDRELLQ